MAKSASKKSNQTLASLLDEISRRLSAKKAAELIHFCQLHFSFSPSEDLCERSLPTLYKSVEDCWDFVQSFSAEESKIHVYNPAYDENDDQLARTVVMVQQLDMPFLIDSIRMEINRRGLRIHQLDNSILSYRRNTKGQLKAVKALSEDNEKTQTESLIYVEIDRQAGKEALDDLKASLAEVLGQVDLVTSDYLAMKSQAQTLIDDVESFANRLAKKDQEELSDFIAWLTNNHFTFLGYEKYKARKTKAGIRLTPVKNSELGFFKCCEESAKKMQLGDVCVDGGKRLDIQKVLTFTKSPSRSKVHRPAYSDFIAIKTYNDAGVVTGEHRFVGLFTSRVYLQTASKIPVIRRKVEKVLSDSKLHPGSHDWKELEQILETYPRDDLLQISYKALFPTAMQILHINERRLTRLFVRKDLYSQYYSCLVYAPRDIYNTEFRVRVENILKEELNSEYVEFNTHFSESILARTQFIVHASNRGDMAENPDYHKIEKRIIEASRTWSDELHHSLIETLGERKSLDLINRYGKAFPSSYRDDFTTAIAVGDILQIETLSSASPLAMDFYREENQSNNEVNFKLFHLNSHLPLSEIIPVMENLGLRVMDEHPYKLLFDDKTCWIHDFRMQYCSTSQLDVETVKQGFQEAFAQIWNGNSENDYFNRLILSANLSWRSVWMLRAYAAYIKQLKFGISQLAIANCLIQHQAITNSLVALFDARFNPADCDVKKAEALEHTILNALEEVPSLTDDRIIRRYLDLIKATLRTNYYQRLESGELPAYVVYKLSPQLLADIPKPKPMFEIFVHSPRIQGVHLRGGKVARGGLRWSDRNEDFRTEVLGLVKAQQVKNAVIVPVGAKGGFIAKRLNDDMSRDEFMQEGIACYRLFISGLLDVTDNIVDGGVVPPTDVIRHDEDDPYLVVAADKGTATFSDIANEISESRNFWLKDAFASGGSQGYDHKKMGITAKGAWVSVQRHFREIGHDIQREDFSVIAIGDMSGDVFGNGMLLSEHICLTAAFNHLHIFIDPNPDSAQSFVERKRLFELPRSSWSDYNTTFISNGGGVFERKAKYINITPEMKKRFDINESRMTPNELLNALLKAPVDLIWNGGIGTYVKSTEESNGDVGDKANDAIRLNGNELRCKVVGEGGNLGLTQRARIEYCLNGGRCNTDFVDNAGGVDCSDHEVNLKILLDTMVASGPLTAKQRNSLLVKMTEAVSDLVLSNNYQQAQSLSLAEAYTLTKFDEFQRVIQFLESRARLNRELEFLPSEEQLQERKLSSKGLTRPELAVLLSYGKALLKEELLHPELTDDSHAKLELATAFPHQLLDRFGEAVYEHKLQAEIIATQIANHMMNDMGLAYLHSLESSTGASSVEIAKAYLLARDVFHMQAIWAEIQALDNQVDAAIQRKMMLDLQRLVRRASRWFLRNRRKSLVIDSELAHFTPAVKELLENMGDWLHGTAKEKWQSSFQGYLEQGIPEALARSVASNESLYMALGAIEVANSSDYPLNDVIDAYCLLGEELKLYWFSEALNNLNVESQWQSLARDAYRDDLDWQVRSLASSLLKERQGSEGLRESYTRWYQSNETRAVRWQSMLSELQSAEVQDYSMFTVAIRELFDLAKGASLT